VSEKAPRTAYGLENALATTATIEGRPHPQPLSGTERGAGERRQGTTDPVKTWSESRRTKRSSRQAHPSPSRRGAGGEVAPQCPFEPLAAEVLADRLPVRRSAFQMRPKMAVDMPVIWTAPAGLPTAPWATLRGCPHCPQPQPRLLRVGSEANHKPPGGVTDSLNR
jgi:hypothetical protein